mmetsp:Transcript_12362/g.25620  ORF Transcript_12362/g.25620 Transcript_12362/m.25620 type:complete len:465 (+) Transcript_12362:176-1570(+)
MGCRVPKPVHHLNDAWELSRSPTGAWRSYAAMQTAKPAMSKDALGLEEQLLAEAVCTEYLCLSRSLPSQGHVRGEAPSSRSYAKAMSGVACRHYKVLWQRTADIDHRHHVRRHVDVCSPSLLDAQWREFREHLGEALGSLVNPLWVWVWVARVRDVVDRVHFDGVVQIAGKVLPAVDRRSVHLELVLFGVAAIGDRHGAIHSLAEGNAWCPHTHVGKLTVRGAEIDKPLGASGSCADPELGQMEVAPKQFRGPRTSGKNCSAGGQDFAIFEADAFHTRPCCIQDKVSHWGCEKAELNTPPLGCVRESPRSTPWVSRPVTCSPNAAHPFTGEAWKELFDLLVVEHLRVQAALCSDRDPLLEMIVTLCRVAKSKVSTFLPADRVPQFVLDVLPALHRLPHQLKLACVPALLTAEAPGLGGLRGSDPSGVDDGHAGAFESQVVSRGASNDATANDKHIGAMRLPICK